MDLSDLNNDKSSTAVKDRLRNKMKPELAVSMHKYWFPMA